MGHEVLSDIRSASLAGKGRLRLAFEEIAAKSGHWRRRVNTRLLRLALDFKPQLTIVCTATLEPDVVETMRAKTGSRVVCWFGDSPGNLKRDHITSGEYDAVFVKDKRFATDLRSVLKINAFHLHEACNPQWHRPVAAARGSHIAVAGTLYGYRVTVVRQLMTAGWEVQCFGPRPSSWVRPDVTASHTGRFLDHTTKATEFGRALACLNTFAPAERDSLNCRIFETCGCGGLLVSERKDAMDECFDAGQEYLPFASAGELLERLARIKADPAAGERIRVNAARRAHAQHTYAHRIKFILEAIS
jgi:spore maturation protein CgeB